MEKKDDKLNEIDTEAGRIAFRIRELGSMQAAIQQENKTLSDRLTELAQLRIKQLEE
jgi:hypothetical protein